jgi:hypothetical protein
MIFCDVTDEDDINTDFLDCKTANEFHCLKKAILKVKLCLDAKDISEDIFTLIKNDISKGSKYFGFMLMIQGEKQVIDTNFFVESKRLCVNYETKVNGCTIPMNPVEGAKFFRNGDGLTIPQEGERCNGIDPFALQDGRELQDEQSYRSTFTVSLPDGVYDSAEATKDCKADKTCEKERIAYIRGRKNICNAAIGRAGKRNASDVLGCKFIIDPEASVQNFALGPVKLTTNVAGPIDGNGYQTAEYGNGGGQTVSAIFEDYTMLELLSGNCVSWDGTIDRIDSRTVAYADSKQYSEEASAATGLDASSNVGGGGYGVSVTATAGYNKNTNSATNKKGLNKSAFGQAKTAKPFGSIDITCLNRIGVLNGNIKIKDRVHKDWKIVRDFKKNNIDLKDDELIEALQKTNEFQNIVNGGLLIPRKYTYTAIVSITSNTIYQEVDSDSSSSVQEVMKASLAASGYGASVGAEVKTQSDIKQKLDEKNIKSESTIVESASGTGTIIATGCNGDCQRYVTEKVSEVLKDGKFSAVPTSATAYVELDELVKGHFDDFKIGLGKLFFEAVDNYFTTVSCDQPNCPSTAYTTTTGSGRTEVLANPCENISTNGGDCSPNCLIAEDMICCNKVAPGDPCSLNGIGTQCNCVQNAGPCTIGFPRPAEDQFVCREGRKIFINPQYRKNNGLPALPTTSPKDALCPTRACVLQTGATNIDLLSSDCAGIFNTDVLPANCKGFTSF